MELDVFLRTHETDTIEMVVGGRRFQLLTPKTLDPYIDPDELFRDFPLWAKAWEASWVLADHLARTPPDTGKRFLEIGAGLGLVSIVAFAFGHRILATEHNPHARDYARASAALNQCLDLRITPLDWRNPDLEGPFDGIFGSEVAYHQADFQPLKNLFKALLKPGGAIFLAGGLRKTYADFLDCLKDDYAIRARRRVLRATDEEIPIVLARMTPH